MDNAGLQLKVWGRGALLGVLAAMSTGDVQGFAESSSSASVQKSEAGGRSAASEIQSGRMISLEGRQTLRMEKSGRELRLWNQDSPAVSVRKWTLPQPRFGASVTRLADGRVLVWGGVDAKGDLLEGGYLLSPQAEGIEATDLDGTSARASHTATVLTDGRVFFAGGKGAAGQAQLWDPKAHRVEQVEMPERTGHTATLQPDGTVLLFGGAVAGMPAARALVFDPADRRFVARGTTWSDKLPLELAGSLPAAGDHQVDPEAGLTLRFNRPVRAADVGDAKISLMGPGGRVEAALTVAESGRLIFFQPAVSLFPDTHYTLLVEGLHALNGEALALNVVEFKTRAIEPENGSASHPTAAELSAVQPSKRLLGCGQTHPLPCRERASLQEGAWQPGRDNTDARWRITAKRAELLPLSVFEAAIIGSGRTAVSGQVLLVNDKPLAGVEISIGNSRTKTDPSGRFVLADVPHGHQELYVDGTSANVAGREYGQFVVGVEVSPKKLTRLPYTMYLPQISARDKTKIASPLKQDAVVTHPDMPGLQIHIPAGTVIRDRKGNLVRELAVVPTPVNRAPFPVPANYPMYFTLEPGGALIQGLTTQAAQGIKVLYPNYDKLPTGTRANFWIYEPSGGWRVYGQGRVTSDGTRIAPEAGVGLYQAMGASYSIDGNTPPPEPDKPEVSDGCGCEAGGAGATAGDPIDLYTGEFSYDEVDAVVGGLVPISVRRLYRSHETTKRDFGIGTAANFRFTLYAPAADYNQLQLVLPTGSPVLFDRVSGSGLTGQWAQAGTMSGYAGATITQGTPSGHGYLLELRDGSKMYFNQYSPNQLEWTLDRFGNRVDYVYDAGLMVQIISANGRYLAMEYDSDNRISAVKDPAGNAWTYTYDVNGYLSKVTRPDGSTRSYRYKISFVAQNVTYQARLESIYDGKNQRVLFNEFETLLGSMWTGRVVKQTQADGGVLKIEYDHSDGDTTGVLVTRPDGSKRRVVFDHRNRYPASDTVAYGTALAQTTRYERTARGQISAKIDALGRRVEYTRDERGRVTQVKAMAGTAQARTTQIAYNADGDLASVTDALNHKVSLGYTDRCLTSVTNALGKVIKATCNSAGQRLTLTNALGHTTSYTWTGEDLTQVSDPLGRKVKFRYDVLGRLIAAEDSQGNISRRQYDGLGRVVKASDPLGNTVETEFDANGNVAAILLPHGNGVTYAYDARDRQTMRTDALDQVERWTYDAMDRVKTYRDRRNRVTTLSYDVLGRSTAVAFPGAGGTLTSSYDAANRTVALADSLGGTLGWAYDAFDQVTEASTPQGTIQYEYDAVGRRTRMQAATQAEVVYTYDSADRLTGITQGAEAVSFAYDNADRLITQTLPNAVQTIYNYNTAGQVTGIAWGKAGQTALGSLGYGYDGLGRLVAQTGTHAPQMLPASSVNNAFDDNNRQTKANNVALSYDANGNLISDGVRSYVWNDRNQLGQIRQGASVIANFSYDALGRRGSRTENGVTTSYLYDGLDAVQEVQGGTANPLLIGLRIDQRFARNDSGGRTYFLTDLLGSTRVLTNAVGSVVQRYDYDPYGKVSQANAAYSNPYQYSGRELDLSGLYYYRARYYHAANGRFISEDPIQLAAGPNAYTYVGGNPNGATDPLGLCSCGLPNASSFMDSYPNYDDYSGSGVWSLIGGSLDDKYGANSPGGTEDSCAARASYGLNESGARIPPGSPGANRNWNGDNNRYIISAQKMNDYLRNAYGPPSQTLNSAGELANLRGGLGNGGAAIVSSGGHVGVVTGGYADPYVGSYLGDVWILPGGNCSCP